MSTDLRGWIQTFNAAVAVTARAVTARLALLAACVCTTGCLAVQALGERLRSDPSVTDRDSTAEARRWPVEIENVLLGLPAREDGDTILTDQHCETVDNGLAHCVRVECQRLDEQTTCVEIVMTARRLRERPARSPNRFDESSLNGSQVRTEASPVQRAPPAGIRPQLS